MKFYKDDDYKKLIPKLKKLSDKDLAKIISIFDVCQECWDDKPEKCEFRAVRKKLGLEECRIYEIMERRKKDEKKLK